MIDDETVMPTVFSRRDFLGVILLSMGGLAAGKVGAGWARTHLKRNDILIASWVGEALEYRVDCPILPRIATGKLEFKRIWESPRFLATLETKIEGILGALTLQREDRFASLMDWSESNGRFLPVWYAEQVTRMGSWRRKVVIFHHDQGKYIEHKIYPHRLRKRRRKTGGRILDDPLSAFYNWRIGAFGPLGPGQNHRIDNLARKDPFVLRLQTASTGETKRRMALYPHLNHGAHLLTAHLDKELMDTVRGDVIAWVDEDWIPLYGKATKVKWVGEITACLERKGRLPTPEHNASPPPPLKQEPWAITKTDTG